MLYADEIRTLRIIIEALKSCPQRKDLSEYCTCDGERCGMSRSGYLLGEAIAELEDLTSRK